MRAGLVASLPHPADETHNNWLNAKRVPADHAEPVAYLTGYRFGRRRLKNPQRAASRRRVGIGAVG